MQKLYLWDFNPKRKYSDDEYWKYLAILNDHIYQRDILFQHADDINILFRKTLTRNPLYHYATETLINCISVMFTHLSFRRWWDRLVESLVYAQELGDRDLIARLTLAIAKYHCLDISPIEAETAAMQAREYSEDGDDDVHLQAYASLIETYIMRPDSKFQPEMFDEALAISARSNNLEMKAVLHQIVAVAHLHRFELDKAEFHTSRAAELGVELHDYASTFRTLIIGACVARLRQDWDAVRKYLAEASNVSKRFPMTARNVVLLNYEQAALHVQDGDLGAAKKSYEAGLEPAVGQQMAYERALCQIALALLLIKLEDFDKARTLTEKAEKVWQKVNNPYFITHAAYTRGFLEFKRGKNFPLALSELDEALLLAQRIPNVKAREAMEISIRETRDQLLNRKGN